MHDIQADVLFARILSMCNKWMMIQNSHHKNFQWNNNRKKQTNLKFQEFFFQYSLILKNCGNILTFINQSSTKYNFHPIYYLTTLMQNMNMCVCVYMFSFFFFKIRWPWTFYLSCLVFIILCIHKTTVIIIQ